MHTGMRRLPLLKQLLASLRVRQDEENSEAAARPSLPPQRRITAQIKKYWQKHQQVVANPRFWRAFDVHLLHSTSGSSCSREVDP
jgi:hypothetical protein